MSPSIFQMTGKRYLIFGKQVGKKYKITGKRWRTRCVTPASARDSERSILFPHKRGGAAFVRARLRDFRHSKFPAPVCLLHPRGVAKYQCDRYRQNNKLLGQQD